MGYAAKKRKRARQRLGIEGYPPKAYGDGVWRVASTTSRDDTQPSGEFCEECGLEFEIGYRPDPCIGGYLPGVSHACCGHGNPNQAYVTGGEGCVADQCASTISCEWCIRGRAAVAFIEANRHLATLEP